MFSLNPQLIALAEGGAEIATWEWDPATDELRWTSGRAEMYSRPASEIRSSRDWEAIIHPDDRARVRSSVEAALEDGTGFRERFRVAGKSGTTRWILGYGKVLRSPGQPLKVAGVNVDVSDWVEALVASEARFTATFEQAAVGIAHVSPDGTWLNVNHRCLEIVGYSKAELLQLTFADITHPDDLEADWALVRDLLEGTRMTYSMEKRYIRKDKRLIWVNLTVSLVRTPDGAPDYFISVVEDITNRKRIETERDELIAQLEERVRERTAELEKLSLSDPLTGIANRRCVDQCLEGEWDRAVRTKQPLSLILIDIDYLKQFNDSAGHAAADDALKAVAGCLREIAQRSADIAARLGGDEFVLVLPDTTLEGALRIADRLQEMIEALNVRNPGSLISPRLTVSQGVAASVPGSKGNWKSLLLEADRALYRAKQMGRARVAKSGEPRIPTSRETVTEPPSNL
jgi:diguanylate cyclase (GGDEF)-like protein/PAS domain S-box-containing protein